MNMFGAMTKTDMESMLEILIQFQFSNVLRFLEIGMNDGNTARGLRLWCEEHSVRLDYWGIDNGAICRPRIPFDGANLIVGDSAEVADDVPGDFDIVFIDGCHCFNHSVLDTFHYTPKVKPDGFAVFHDTSPEIQQTMRDPHGPEKPMFHNSVNLALETIGFPWKGWELFLNKYEPNATIGGIRAYRRTGTNHP